MADCAVMCNTTCTLSRVYSAELQQTAELGGLGGLAGVGGGIVEGICLIQLTSVKKETSSQETLQKRNICVNSTWGPSVLTRFQQAA